MADERGQFDINFDDFIRESKKVPSAPVPSAIPNIGQAAQTPSISGAGTPQQTDNIIPSVDRPTAPAPSAIPNIGTTVQPQAPQPQAPAPLPQVGPTEAAPAPQAQVTDPQTGIPTIADRSADIEAQAQSQTEKLIQGLQPQIKRQAEETKRRIFGAGAGGVDDAQSREMFLRLDEQQADQLAGIYANQYNIAKDQATQEIRDLQTQLNFERQQQSIEDQRLFERGVTLRDEERLARNERKDLASGIFDQIVQGTIPPESLTPEQKASLGLPEDVEITNEFMLEAQSKAAAEGYFTPDGQPDVQKYLANFEREDFIEGYRDSLDDPDDYDVDELNKWLYLEGMELIDPEEEGDTNLALGRNVEKVPGLELGAFSVHDFVGWNNFMARNGFEMRSNGKVVLGGSNLKKFRSLYDENKKFRSELNAFLR